MFHEDQMDSKSLENDFVIFIIDIALVYLSILYKSFQFQVNKKGEFYVQPKALNPRPYHPASSLAKEYVHGMQDSD